jgi:hypothetical protein
MIRKRFRDGEAMKTVTLDRPTVQALTEMGPLVQVQDGAGEIVGYFAPLAKDRAAGYAAAAAAAHLYRPSNGKSDEPTYTTPEVLAYLDSLGSR